MAMPNEFMLADMKAKYEEQASSAAFDRLYVDDAEFGHMFSVLHKRLNEHFEGINGRARSTRHYWADPSRDMIALIDEINADLYDLKRAGIHVTLDATYQEALERCRPWLSPSGGSTVPEDFEQINVLKFEQVFARQSDSIALANQPEKVKLTMVGEGSYAHVYSYVDPEYDIKFAVKRAKRGISERDLARFKQEFEVMKRLSFPYVVQVFRFDEDRNEYRMEFCEETLRAYVTKRNSKLTFSTRKRVALQFLYGLNYIHSQGLLHRDISLQNVLMKVYSSGAVLVKLSDFGLVKEATSDFTLTQTELRGTILDPQLESLKAYNVTNEIYATGWVLSFIFTGRQSLGHGTDDAAQIVKKCTDHDPGQRYGSVLDLIADVEALVTTPTDAPA
jgi:tRNA A-37 threonylcarbamoyl transferase component Bud32